ncbi:hypothetical protein IPA_09540 [Ignicoccus pacificus DSM 13166]|uniref:DUF2029 domain-containing protein n=1 Tax=Ignicoccus pacificus DSM 13166 TaxID=940294 RepID=A0A977KDI7_9CREN|nr:hypothetical protein IPA_09540 [Ignicoccus pacificus DSM 13166]
MKKIVLGLTLLLILAIMGGSAWDTYVFIESTRLFVKGIDPYVFYNDVRAYLPGLGPMWLTYPPLPLFLWAPFIAPLVYLKIPLSWLYTLAVKIPSIIALLASVYMIKKKNGKWVWVLFNPIAIATIFIHGMFDVIVAFFLLFSLLNIDERKELSAISFGLALATKQHAVLAAPAFLAYFLKKKDFKNMIKFFLIAALAFAMVILAFEAIFGFNDISYLLKSVFLFHTKRPPNGLGFGGFAVMNFYADAFDHYAGNTAVALYMGGHASVLSKIVDKIALLMIPAVLLALKLDPLTATFLIYLDYIALSYVGAIQHMVVPMVLAGLVLAKDDKLRKILLYSFTLYAIEHVLVFWDFFPMFLSPLFLKQFGMWMAYISRLSDTFFPYWAMLLRAFGVVVTSAALALLLIFLTLYYKEKFAFRFSGLIIPTLYVLEILLLAIFMSGVTGHVAVHHPSQAKGWCLLVPWENSEYPGYRMGDYLSPFAIPTPLGYYSYVYPVAEKVIKDLKGRCNIAILAREDLFRAYQYVDLLSVIMKYNMTYAWVITSNKNYLEGLGSGPYQTLIPTILSNIPYKKMFRMGGIMGFMNLTFNFLPPISYQGYYKVHNRPVIFVWNINPNDLITIKEMVRGKDVVILPFRGKILDIKALGLSIIGG